MENKVELFKTLSQYKKELEAKGYNVLYIGLYGSQNYNLSDENSDVDARAVVLPTIRQLLTGGTVSKVYDVSNGQVDVKDLVTFVKTLQKGNPAYIESAETEVYIGDKRVRELLQGFKVKPMAVYGMAMEKFTAIEKGLPKTAPTVEALGYDTKQLHHIVRLGKMLDEAFKTGVTPTFQYLEGAERDELMALKRGDVEDAPEKEFLITEYLQQFKDKYREGVGQLEYEAPEFPEAVYDFLEVAMVEVLFKPNDTLEARAERTFGGNVPKRDLAAFPMLEEHQGDDVSYVVYSYLEFLGNHSK